MGKVKALFRGIGVVTLIVLFQNFTTSASEVTNLSCQDLNSADKLKIFDIFKSGKIVDGSTCTIKNRLRILAANVDFDCNGATIDASDWLGEYGKINTDLDGKSYYESSCRKEAGWSCATDTLTLHERNKPTGIVILNDGIKSYDKISGNVVLNKSSASLIRDVTLRNCKINNMYEGFRVGWTDAVYARNTGMGLSVEVLKKLAPQRVTLDNVQITNSISRGGFIGDHASNVKIVNSKFTNTMGMALYLEFGSFSNKIQASEFANNGQGGIYNGASIRQREAISVDSSSSNLIQGNTFRNNTRGGVYLYKNCWEAGGQKGNDDMQRTQRSNYNVIRGNTFIDERVGVWIASRQDMNLKAFACADEKEDISKKIPSTNSNEEYFEDFARSNVVDSNSFQYTGNVDLAMTTRTYWSTEGSWINYSGFHHGEVMSEIGVFVQDNDNIVVNNDFSGIKYPIVAGSKIREKTVRSDGSGRTEVRRLTAVNNYFKKTGSTSAAESSVVLFSNAGSGTSGTVTCDNVSAENQTLRPCSDVTMQFLNGLGITLLKR